MLNECVCACMFVWVCVSMGKFITKMQQRSRKKKAEQGKEAQGKSCREIQ